MNQENSNSSELLTEASYQADAMARKLDAALSSDQLPQAHRQSLSDRIFAATVSQLPLRAKPIRTLKNWNVQTWFGPVPMRALAAMVCFGLGLTWWGLVDPINTLSGRPTSLLVVRRVATNKTPQTRPSFDLGKLSGQLRELTTISSTLRLSDMDQELITLSSQITPPAPRSSSPGTWEASQTAIEQELSTMNAAGID